MKQTDSKFRLAFFPIRSGQSKVLVTFPEGRQYFYDVSLGSCTQWEEEYLGILRRTRKNIGLRNKLVRGIIQEIKGTAIQVIRNPLVCNPLVFNPYYRKGRTIYTKSSGEWEKKQTCKSVDNAKGALRLLRGIEHGWTPTRRNPIKLKELDNILKRDFGPPFMPEGFVKSKLEKSGRKSALSIHIGDRDVKYVNREGLTDSGTNIGTGKRWDIRRIRNNPAQYQFVGDCVNNPFESVNKLSEIIDGGEEVTKSSFLRWCDVPEELANEMRRYPNDYIFYRNAEEDVFFFTWSAIGHFYSRDYE